MPPSFKLLVISIIVQAMQLMGQEGMVRGSGVERNYRDARWTNEHDNYDDHGYKYDDDKVDLL